MDGRSSPRKETKGVNERMDLGWRNLWGAPELGFHSLTFITEGTRGCPDSNLLA